MAKVGVLLSGCGVYDGAEIHEAVLTLLALDRAGAEIVCMAPNTDQMHVVDHTTGKVTGERRNVLVESARIARGDIRDLARVKAADIDALILPGGFGAAKNLSDFAVAGAAAKVHPEVARLLREMVAAKKPVGAMCIAPAVLAAVLGKGGAELTIGTDAGTASTLEKMGVKHVPCPVHEDRLDARRKLVSTPAYMLAGRISEAAAGIEKLVADVLRLA
ncbi:MAG: isoprenoid biosynthesis glyoxalase ElbB [Planctomycetota bacterium]